MTRLSFDHPETGAKEVSELAFLLTPAACPPDHQLIIGLLVDKADLGSNAAVVCSVQSSTCLLPPTPRGTPCHSPDKPCQTNQNADST